MSTHAVEIARVNGSNSKDGDPAFQALDETRIARAEES